MFPFQTIIMAFQNIDEQLVKFDDLESTYSSSVYQFILSRIVSVAKIASLRGCFAFKKTIL